MRTLNEAQRDRIDRLIEADGLDGRKTAVVGWHRDGPLVRYPNGLVRVVSPDGRLRAVPREVAIAVEAFA